MCDAMRDEAGGETFWAKDAIRPNWDAICAWGRVVTWHVLMLDFIPFERGGSSVSVVSLGV